MDFKITEGDTPTLNDTLLNADGTAFDLTGWTVAFHWQGPATASAPATVVLASAGTVRVALSAAQTVSPGDYVAQWRATKGGEVRTFPTEPLRFEIVPRVPVTPPAQVSLIADFVDPVRAILGDFHAKHRRYPDAAIEGVVRTMVRMGKAPGYGLTADRRGLTPAIPDTDVANFALLVYHAALTLLNPNAARYSYRTRAMSESFGDQRHFVTDLQNAIADLEFGEMFVSYQHFYSWVNGVAGLDVWMALTELQPPATMTSITLTSSGAAVTG